MRISVIIVAFNAEKTILNTFLSIKNQNYDHKLIEIILVNSNSTDNTLILMENFKNQEIYNFFDIKIIQNPKKRLPSGINLALLQTTGDVILRLDAHSEIQGSFIRKNIRNIKNGHDISGGVILNKLKPKLGFIEKMIVMAENSMFGGSVAKFRRKKDSGYVKTLAFACYKREVFAKVGGYDDRLLRTEDNDIHFKMRQAGFKFFFDSKIRATRQARESMYGIVRQKFLNGYWIALTSFITPKMFEIYHYIPFLFVSGLVLGSILVILGYKSLLGLIMFLYLSVLYIITIIELLNKNMKITTLFLPVFLALLHISYGIGTLVGFIKYPFWKERKQECREVLLIREYFKK